MKTTLTNVQIKQAAEAIMPLSRLKMKPLGIVAVVGLKKAIMAQAEALQEAHQKLIDQHAHRDEAGRYTDAEGKPLPDGSPYCFRDQKAADAEYVEMMNAKVEIKHGLISLAHFSEDLPADLVEGIQWAVKELVETETA